MHWKIHPPRPSRFPSGGDFAPLGPRDCPRASPSGNLSGLGVQNPRPWEISWASGGVFSDTSLLSAVYGFNKSIAESPPRVHIKLHLLLGELSKSSCVNLELTAIFFSLMPMPQCHNFQFSSINETGCNSKNICDSTCPTGTMSQ